MDGRCCKKYLPSFFSVILLIRLRLNKGCLLYTSTHGTVYDIIVSKEFLGKGDKVLVIDDFLAKGKALDGLTTLIQDSGAELVGAGIVIEKGFQDGGKRIRDKGIRVESLAIVDSMNAETGEIVFRNEDK